MAEVDVKKNQKDEKAVARRGESELATWGDWDPLSWWRTPSEFFRDPFSVMRRFREEMDRVFARSFGEEFGNGAWMPAIEVSEQNGNLQVRAELAGLKPEDVKIEATEDSLVIQGERKSEHEEKREGVFRSERRYGKFYREIPLPEGAKVDQAKAHFDNGVLEVTLPIPERKSNRRQIPIGGPVEQKK
ncbi:MAG TPA: Hsp20/alpha crystallin family protein [Bryobacteraceae bacterium]|jgi:HSP20 family protein|nr:Hsp20/alpha crystallin family protein [Bryobacteraceae bacterium]